MEVFSLSNEKSTVRLNLNENDIIFTGTSTIRVGDFDLKSLSIALRGKNSVKLNEQVIFLKFHNILTDLETGENIIIEECGI